MRPLTSNISKTPGLDHRPVTDRFGSTMLQSEKTVHPEYEKLNVLQLIPLTDFNLCFTVIPNLNVLWHIHIMPYGQSL